MDNKVLVRFLIGLAFFMSQLSAANDGDRVGKGLSQNHFYYILGMPPWAVGEKDNLTTIRRVEESLKSLLQFRIGFALKNVFHNQSMNKTSTTANGRISS